MTVVYVSMGSLCVIEWHLLNIGMLMLGSPNVNNFKTNSSSHEVHYSWCIFGKSFSQFGYRGIFLFLPIMSFTFNIISYILSTIFFNTFIQIKLKVNDMIGRNENCLENQTGWKINQRYTSCSIPHGWKDLSWNCLHYENRALTYQHCVAVIQWQKEIP